MIETPVRDYKVIIDDGGPGYVNRLLIGTPTTGLVRMEWVQSRYGQIIPVNWSMVNLIEFVSGYVPLRYQVDDAQNLIVKSCIEQDFEWLLLWEHDTIPQPGAMRQIDEYIRKADIPIVSGLYYTRSRPADPLVFRGRGVGPYTDWELGDKVWVDGVPTGFLLIHSSILRVMWDESEEYQVRGSQTTRRVFRTPRDLWYDPETGFVNTQTGTSDLHWCSRIMDEDIFKKAGWEKYQDMEYPFLIDTNLFCQHINPNGEIFP